MKRARVFALALARASAVLVLVAGQIWCATNDDAEPSPPPVTPLDAGTPDAPVADDAPGSEAPPVCTASFCRVMVAGSEDVALNGVLVRSASDVWVVGSTGFAAHYDGAAWQRIATSTNQSLFAVWGATNGPVWATNAGQSFFLLDRPAADGGVEMSDGGWKSIVTAISGIESGEAYAVGSVSSNSPFGGDDINGDNIWRYVPAAAGSDDSAGWTPVSPACTFFDPLGCVTLHAVWVQNAHVQWFAGQNGKIYRTDASDPDPADGGDAGTDHFRLHLVEMNSSSLRTLNGLWGFGDHDVWAVGAQGTIRHYTGGEAWEIVPSPVSEDLRAVWGSRPDDVWAAGDDGVVIHWDGAAWSARPTPFGETNRPRLYAISGTGSDVWIAGESTLLRAVSGATNDGGAP